ncbi:ribosomal protein L7Ae/L30e/S12e/Gadd45 [Desulfofarcimen acetoxidans DSM 771]|jgi:ribosomal protein L7Ae-like RNA K-turn-binding protein|uniref:Ribosomal protein L7Ae/L30e/S12e/Gadd45 n=1 Tax=Desulfofarcimen acetoxidans (strain ATCC 49208 / DSM 771 / KCTC 5769 / VKM B-1644 / 5575) TaxID=485916 RepID=C8W4P5_DESAS|nr:ribosomal L7Ae/L30e/S12e/Gadd45 family protein [Desulfofarcimen acetoxidans]ACV63931.1 ribosomal protein L7Ae/L30e/S12e/Gadd45 [Desulfofarcimen acetoxidans DSM 771]
MLQPMYQLLGLACRAGKLVSGDLAVKDAVAGGKGKLLLIAGDCSERTSNNFKQLALKYKIPLLECSTKADLGGSIGKTPRSVAVVIGDDFAQGVLKAAENGGVSVVKL